ncbi:hypothetical protein PACTADRAFT_79047 [Pachysolen tannophilus NRRL Y-2460]|uniref:DUF1753-domain-containing protein n=1 Tax=Pachysolen tannophilus NRRL Y-2460 TaxID=669874 RepID=A0A1E4TY51_PACTA|nr:hypothetical protein PACTADRAFT_79047 [Pachysolen tannophilus NRRL Y-2460]
MRLLSNVLPRKFIGFLPLYIGIELILGFAILNKVSGFYGLLSLFTGHPIDFMQWIYYMQSIFILPFYVYGLKALHEPRSNANGFKMVNVHRMSLVTVLYTIDTVLSVLFSGYFSWFYFSGKAEEADAASASVIQNTFDNGAQIPNMKRAVTTSTNSSESASTTYELFLTFVTILCVSVARFYFNIVMLSFSKNLIKAARFNNNNNNNTTDTEQSPASMNKFQRILYEWELKSTELLKTWF